MDAQDQKENGNGEMLVTLADVLKHLAFLVFMGDTLCFLETEVRFNLSNRAQDGCCFSLRGLKIKAVVSKGPLFAGAANCIRITGAGFLTLDS